MRTLVAAMVMVALAGVAAGCTDGGPPGSSRSVEVLWYGVQPDGSILGGTLESRVDLRHLVEGVGIDVSGISASGAGEMWTASAWTAAVLALLFYGGVPDGLELAVEVADTIDGPSAGGLITAAALADLPGVELRPGVSMTGTISPNGAIGPVGGVPEKLRAAKEAGLTTVAVPDSNRRAIDPRTNEEVDVAELADMIGITVVFVRSLSEARAVLFDEEPLPAGPAVPFGGAGVEASFAKKARDLAGRLNTVEVDDAPSSGSDGEVASLRAALDAERVRLMSDTPGEVSARYFAASALERRVLAWNSAVAVANLAQTQGVDAAISEVRRRAAATTALAGDVAIEVAGTPVDYVEQLMALIDVTEWATDAIEVAEAVRYRLDTDPPTDPVALGALAGELTAQDYHLSVTVGDVIGPALAFGALPVGERTLNELGVFASVIDAAVDANVAVLDLKAVGGSRGVDPMVVDALGASDEAIDRVVSSAPDGQARSIVALADGISRYVATSKLLNLERTATTSNGLLGGLSLIDADFLADQIDLAVETSNMALGVIAARGGDPGYFVWEAQWAAALADTGDDVNADDRFLALSRLWFANVNERILVALTVGSAMEAAS